MVRIALVALALLAATPPPPKEAVGKNYRFVLPKGVTADTQNDKITDFYSFRWSKPPTSVLCMIHVTSIKYTPKTFKTMVGIARQNREGMARRTRNANAKLTETEVNLGPFRGTQFELVTRYTTGRTRWSCWLLLNDGKHIWQGQLGPHSAEDIRKAHAILKTATRIANQPTPSP